jgi:hypothetical protein
MKTKELIRLLSSADPSGEAECCIDNCDIIDVDLMEYYYDGRCEVFRRDANGKIIGAGYLNSGTKIKIRARSISEYLFDFDLEKFPVDYSGLDDGRAKSYRESHEKTKVQNKETARCVALLFFRDYARKRAQTIASDTRGIEYEAERFFNMCLGDDYPMPKKYRYPTTEILSGKPYTVYPSWCNQRDRQWDDIVELSYDGSEWRFRLKPQVTEE